jgi:hypothetical protein
MGLFGGGNSKNTTSNSDNRVINDYSGQEIDNSIYQDTDNSIMQEIDSSLNGNYNNNSGMITVTDGGAFALADSVSQNNAELTDTALNLAGSVADFALQTGFELGDRGLAVGENVAYMGLDTAENLAIGYGDFVNEQGNRNLDAALMVSQSGIEQLQIGSDLALAISAQGSEQQANNNDALTGGFKSAMQFVEDFSRSDGASIAETTNKTMMFLVGAAVVGIFIIKKVK